SLPASYAGNQSIPIQNVPADAGNKDTPPLPTLSPSVPQTRHGGRGDGFCAKERERRGNWLALVWAFARREALELARDRLRLAFALLGPIALLLIAAFSISFDINRVHFAVIDHDASATSRSFIEPFQGARIFKQVPSPSSREEGEDWLRDGRIKLLIDVPPGFGRELAAGRKAEAAFIIDGAIPFTAASVRGYASMMAAQWAAGLMQQRAALSPALLDTARLMPVTVRARYVYNQDFRSIDAITPGIIMLAMIMIPTMLTALGVVREKEIGSIINLYASPASVGQYLLGKQLPYAALASASFVTLVLAAITIVGVPLRGSALALLAGGVLFALTATALGLFVSAVVRSQVAAIAACALICLIPSANFAGLLYPISTLKGVSAAIGYGFPSSWFQLISLGAFTKGLGAASFVQPYLVLTGMALFCMTLARLLLRRQL
ncbi:MAG: ABC transporter permease, partial [Ottowia sp.]|nr:ABC transporter permease [Ottowia sp.]